MKFFNVWYVCNSRKRTNGREENIRMDSTIAIHSFRPHSDYVPGFVVNYMNKHEDEESERLGYGVVMIATEKIDMKVESTTEFAEMVMTRWSINNAKIIFSEEITFRLFIEILNFNFSSPDNGRSFAIKYNMRDLHELSIRRSQGILGEQIFSDSECSFDLDTLSIEDLSSMEKLMKVASSCSNSKALQDELQRIYANDKADNSHELFIPVHYIIEGESPKEIDKARDIILKALLDNNRLVSNHIYSFDFDFIFGGKLQIDNENASMCSPGLAEVLNGNVVVIKYGINDGENRYDSEAYTIFNKLLVNLAKFQNTTQIIWIVPPNKTELRKRVKNIFSTPFIEICDNESIPSAELTNEKVMKLLKESAERDGIEIDDELLTLAYERKYKTAAEVNELYLSWSIGKEIRNNYSQYNKFEEAIRSRRLAKYTDDSKALERLDRLIGLEEQKKKIHNLIKRFHMSEIAISKGLPVVMPSLHMAFLGAPGTGKTEVAKLYGEILRDEGILSEGRVITVSADNWNVRKTFEAAKGSVLFIDEAYGMGHFSQTTDLITCMEEYRNEVVVILAGYASEMEGLIRSNQGFRSRLGDIIKFADYSDKELLDIFILMCENKNLKLTKDAKVMVREILARGGKRGDQGNARYVRNLFEKSVGCQLIRLNDEHEGDDYSIEILSTITVEDVCEAVGMIEERNDSKRILTEKISGREEFSKLIGLDEIKFIIGTYLDFVKVQKIRRDKGISTEFMPMHMVFRGNPGSGKTEVARLISKILKEEGILSEGRLIELDGLKMNRYSALGLTDKMFEEAKGSVLFIDEAYTLGYGAIADIIKNMEDLRDQVVVILAGYSEEMELMLKQNPGFESRIRINIEFNDYSKDELLRILDYMTAKKKMIMKPEVKPLVEEYIEVVSKNKRFGNARFIRMLLENSIIAQGSRVSELVMDDNIEDDKIIEILNTLEAVDFIYGYKMVPIDGACNKQKIGFSIA